MGLEISASGAEQMGEGVWAIEMPPHQVRMFGSPSNSDGDRSVLLLKSAIYDAASRSLKFTADDAVALNVGTLSETIVVKSSGVAVPEKTSISGKVASRLHLGPGDKEFLSLVKRELPACVQEAAEKLLEGVRRRSSGDLKRGQKKNFSETPDNFWYVIVQPRVKDLQITVRGTVEYFNGISSLQIKNDRGNTRFKVKDIRDVEGALSLIFHAKRKY